MAVVTKAKALKVIATTKLNPLSFSKLDAGRYLVTKTNDNYRFIYETAPKVWKELQHTVDVKEGQRTICFTEVKNRKTGLMMSVSVSKEFIEQPLTTNYIVDIDDKGFSKFVTGEITDTQAKQITSDVIETVPVTEDDTF